MSDTNKPAQREPASWEKTVRARKRARLEEQSAALASRSREIRAEYDKRIADLEARASAEIDKLRGELAARDKRIADLEAQLKGAGGAGGQGSVQQQQKK